ncbi:Very-long-chain enoyl-CoA reductase [Vanrija pseudolonga]|uniref:Very-long-chain enoyl-CoA reductase n=1 Tax=Vanrija pseudolonga TaxID=143232 RepID=A0AAF0YCL3_9TREE|nr:Very-long-chain enoyl-CoA reductase [Vanrija pseudolonga]
MVSVTVSIPGKGPQSFDFPGKTAAGVTVGDLKAAIRAKVPKFVPNRQRLTAPSGGEKEKPLPLTDEGKSLADYGVADGAKLRLKDLGYQVGYRWLFIWEYIGPIFINPALLYVSQYIWGPYEPSQLQLTVRNLIVAHFVKRELESVFVHKFSRPSVPLTFVIRNCAYYWGITGGLIGLTLYRPGYGAVALKDSILNTPAWLNFWTAFILANELLNLNTHLHLSSLRTAPGEPRKYPTGFGFQWIVCANYFFETMGVLGLVIITGGDIGTIVYLLIASYFMGLWAGQKYRRYKKEHDPKVFPGRRWVVFPPFF